MENKFLKLTNTVYKVLEFFPESDPLKNRAKDKALAIMDHLVLINENTGWASFQKEKVKAHLLEDIDILLGYLWIGKSQGWLNSANCLIIANEYEKVRKDIEPVLELTQKLPGIDGPVSGEKEKLTPTPLLESVATVELENEKDLEGGEEDPVLVNESEEPEDVLDNVEPDIAYDKAGTSERQKKILDFLAKNVKAQVMDLQTILPDVTKRTIRRDLDELLENGQIVRRGDFNQVFYQAAHLDMGGLVGEQHLIG